MIQFDTLNGKEILPTELIFQLIESNNILLRRIEELEKVVDQIGYSQSETRRKLIDNGVLDDEVLR